MISKIGRTCFAGFLGTIVITCMVTFASPDLLGGPADIATVLARMLGGSWLAGLLMHFVVGTLALPAFYLVLVERRLPGGPAVRGALWGVALWVVSQVTIAPWTGGGFFSSASGGFPMATNSLIGHLVYGLVLGVFAGAPNERAFALRQEFEVKPPLRRAA
jgi:hypothetical protein